MSLAVLRSRALAGMEALCVSVEVHLANGLPGLTIEGNNRPVQNRGAPRRIDQIKALLCAFGLPSGQFLTRRHQAFPTRANVR